MHVIIQCRIKYSNVELQVDFSENASIASKNEVQSAHWSHGYATLFTAHAWISDGVILRAWHLLQITIVIISIVCMSS